MTAPISAPSTARYPALDSLRGAAALSVISFHAACALGVVFVYSGWHWDFARYDATRGILQLLLSWPTVPTMFFVLSGFLVHGGLRRATPEQLPRKLLRRGFRLYLPYLVLLLFFALIFPSTRITGRPHDGIVELLVHVFLLSNLRDEWIGAINPSFWYVATELQFCMLYPLLMLAVRKYGWWGAVGIAAGVEMLVRFGRVGALIAGYDTAAPLDGALMHTPFAYCFTWTAGAMLAELYHRKELRRDMAWKLLPWALVGLAALLCRFTPPLRSPCMALFYIGVITLLVCPRSVAAHAPATLLSRVGTGFNRHLKFVGTCGFILYLINQPLLDAVAHRVAVYMQPSALMVVCVAMAGYAVMLPIAWAFHVLVEQRCISIGNRLVEFLHPTIATSLPSLDKRIPQLKL